MEDNRLMFYGANRNVFKNAYMLRTNETAAEKLLWSRLSKNQLGIRFKRQHPMSDYVADFYCHKAKLIIEVDENHHLHTRQKDYDDSRTKVVEEFGLHVLRFSDVEIYQNLDRVIEVVKKYLGSSLQ